VVVAFGGPVIATFATGLSITGAVVTTGIAVYAAYTEGLNAYAAMHSADQAIITALRGVQRQANGLREARNNLVSADGLAVSALQSAEQARSRAVAAVDAIERALQGISASSQFCADAARLQTKIDGLRGDILTKLRTVQQMVITSRSLIAGCKTAADAQAILNGYNNARNTLQEIEVAAKEAEAARAQVTSLIPKLVRGGPTSTLLTYVEQLDNAITLIKAAEDEVVKVTAARETARGLLVDYATRISNLTRDVGQLEQNYLNLSFREWVLTAFGGTRPDVQGEITAARSLLKAHDEPPGARINTEDFQRRVDEVAAGSTLDGGFRLASLRTRAKELETRILAARCDFTDSPDAINRIRLLLEDARIEFGKGSDLPAAAAA
jgi:hypothetical protein